MTDIVSISLGVCILSALIVGPFILLCIHFVQKMLDLVSRLYFTARDIVDALWAIAHKLEMMNAIATPDNDDGYVEDWDDEDPSDDGDFGDEDLGSSDLYNNNP